MSFTAGGVGMRFDFSIRRARVPQPPPWCRPRTRRSASLFHRGTSSDRYRRTFELHVRETCDSAIPSSAIGLCSSHSGTWSPARRQIRKAQHQQHAIRRARHESNRRLDDRHAGALRADQGSGDVETVLGKSSLSGKPGDAPRNLRKARSDLIGVFVAQRFELRVDLAATAAGIDDLREFVVGRGPTRIRRPSYVTISSSSTFSSVLPAVCACMPQELFPIIPPKVLRLWVAGSGPKVSSAFFGFIAQVVVDATGLDAGGFPFPVDLDDAVHVLAEVHDDRRVARLAGQARPPAARKRPAHRNCDRRRGSLDVFGVFGNHEPDRTWR